MNSIMIEQKYQDILSSHPFLSYLVYGGNDYIGIIQNADENITTIYDFSLLKTNELKVLFLSLADSWWWESNRLIPINVFLKQDWAVFRPTLRTLNSKEVDIKFGPYLNLKELSAKRSKRRAITLVRRPA
jgi:hypothetical protein